MTRTHVPVLAGELIDRARPRARRAVAVDCTFGAGGHARLVADRVGPAGEIVCIDRDPHAEEHFEDFAAEVPCETRFIRGDYADVLPELLDEGLAADLVYLDLGISSMQVDARERGFSYSYDAPLDMRMDPVQDLDARTVVNEWDERAALAQLFRQYGEERYARRIAREIVRRRDAGADRDHRPSWSTRSSARCRPRRQFGGGHPAQARLPGDPDRRQRRARARSSARCPLAWELLRPGGRIAAISFHSLEDRCVKRFFADRARGCICPPDLPVCACGREPEAELLTRRAVRPSAGEVADNPRAEVRPPARGAEACSAGGEGSAAPAPKIEGEGR